MLKARRGYIRLFLDKIEQLYQQLLKLPVSDLCDLQ